MRVKSLSEQVYDYINRLIRTGELKNNDKIDDVALVETLGVSRTPIREALIQLTSDGLLTNKPRKGFFVKEQSQEEMDQAFQVIACLDCYALELAMKNADKAKLLNSLRMCIDEIDLSIKEDNYEKYYDWQENFHVTYQSECGNIFLQKELHGLLRRWLRMTYYDNDKYKLFHLLPFINDQHKAVVKSLEQNDIEQAKRILWDHWTREYECVTTKSDDE